MGAAERCAKERKSSPGKCEREGKRESE